jgi:hypothetical protein
VSNSPKYLYDDLTGQRLRLLTPDERRAHDRDAKRHARHPEGWLRDNRRQYVYDEMAGELRPLTPDEKREQRLERARRYRRSPEGQAARRRWQRSKNGKASQAGSMRRYHAELKRLAEIGRRVERGNSA